MIPVTKPFLPPKEDYISLIDDIWQRQWLTNNGPLVNELEEKLKNYLGVDNLLFLSNGTIAIQLAIKALELKGEIITTPFSYVATTSSIVWEGCTPVFVDIDSKSFNIDVNKIEEAITEKTSAILATHVYGNPCDIDTISKIAQKHNLKVIYDAAHCFGTLYKGKSVFSFGDISTGSFHATKVFHTIEGGAVFTKSSELLKKMSYFRNFGHETPIKFESIGINAKNSEFHAAMGLVNLNYIDEILLRRREISMYYDFKLSGFAHTKPQINEFAKFNYSYYPILLENERHVVKAIEVLNSNYIYPRRYFYPSLDTLPYVKESNVPVCKSIVNRVLCLPLYHSLKNEDVDLICRLLISSQ
ncbi:DegT/DnrJ/EryC1/StrS family aminotransferase [Cecembia lonarensis]|uniref:UDP-4-amino-4-deoxy-L-arabinose--oxoglutarate aminotransferase n=1 Tax=Cecembia lonarensis (strain CCUG 58316 / KCTC 22772 / LW9) TaxID=1225176 RepID=K1L1I5_CECL9|nr:DegT/DnrJ/EryC1/StrS family aminotransferase [Cecembia lonarensis]EKB48621.1 UDP-4-amino-4-deoxy-L-arabinose--oxoglutarate aminotransferase [Cecembia lonarensis LW9]